MRAKCTRASVSTLVTGSVKRKCLPCCCSLKVESLGNLPKSAQMPCFLVTTNNTEISSPSFPLQSSLIFRDYHPSVVQNTSALQLKVLRHRIVAHSTPVILVVNGTTRQGKLTPERNFKFQDLNVQTEAVQ